MKVRRISMKILLILVGSLLFVEAVILIPSALTREQELADELIERAVLLDLALDAQSIDSSAERSRALERLGEAGVIEIAAADPGVDVGTTDRDERRLRYYGEHAVIELDATHIGEGVRRYALNIVGLVIIIVVFMVAVSYLFMHRFLVRPLLALERNLAGIATGEGDLTQRLEIRSSDEIGRIAGHFNRFVGEIHHLVGEAKGASAETRRLSGELRAAVENSAEVLGESAERGSALRTRIEGLNSEIQSSSSSTRQIEASVSELRATSDRQRHAVGESRSAIEEINETADQLAGDAIERRDAAQRLLEGAERAAERMRNSVRTMEEIESSTGDILGLITVIDDIAARTNLLSMNAAIEAAHAGEAGRGFAVVAEEVRALATQSSRHAADITRTLKAEVEKIGQAGSISREAGEQFESIVAELTEVSGAMTRFAEGNNAQSRHIGQVTAAIQEVDSGTQEVNTAATQLETSTEEVAGALSNISEVSREVNETMQTIAASLSDTLQRLERMREASLQTDSAAATIDSRVNRFVTES